MQWGEHWRLLVPAGENNAHQLPGTSSCRFSNEGLFEGLSWNLSPAAPGQLHSDSVYQQSWGDCVVSSHLLCKSLWLWALERDIVITAQHILGVSNTVADLESRLERDRSDWMLAHEVFQTINQIFGPLEVDLFASRLTHQLPRFFSWRIDPLAEAMDAFQQDWKRMKGYANPPWC